MLVRIFLWLQIFWLKPQISFVVLLITALVSVSVRTKMSSYLPTYLHNKVSFQQTFVQLSYANKAIPKDCTHNVGGGEEEEFLFIIMM